MALTTIINMEQYKYNYGRKCSQARIKTISIKLPTKNNNPDFTYMENYIKSLNYSASLSLGMSHFQAMRKIILPQAIKRALPTLIGEIISLVKDSSLVSIIAITDLTKVGREIVANTFSPFETWIVIALVYLSLTFTLSYIGSKIEKKMASQGGMA